MSFVIGQGDYFGFGIVKDDFRPVRTYALFRWFAYVFLHVESHIMDAKLKLYASFCLTSLDETAS